MNAFRWIDLLAFERGHSTYLHVGSILSHPFPRFEMGHRYLFIWQEVNQANFSQSQGRAFRG
jgi:hypothetical protein